MSDEMIKLRKYLVQDIEDLKKDINNTKKIIHVSLLTDYYFTFTILFVFSVLVYLFVNLFSDKHYISLIALANGIIAFKYFYSINKKDNQYLNVDRYKEKKCIKAFKERIVRNKNVILQIDFGEELKKEEYIWLYNKNIII